MSNPEKKGMSKRAKLIFFYFNILLTIVGLSLVGVHIYLSVVYDTALGAALFAGAVITIYALIAIFKDNPYKSTNTEADKEEP